MTISTLLFFGVQRGRAFELSMLMSLPAVLGAILLEVSSGLADIHRPDLALLGVLVALGSGVLALKAVRHVVVGGRFHWFALWVLPLAFATLAMAHSWPE
jgi:undecaprenyl pyrophosphate phosphatase UppP